MFRGLLDLMNVLLLWGLAYVSAILVFVLVFINLTEDNKQIIYQPSVTNTFPIRKPVVEVCNRIDGCPIVDNVCVGCVLE